MSIPQTKFAQFPPEIQQTGVPLTKVSKPVVALFQVGFLIRWPTNLKLRQFCESCTLGSGGSGKQVRSSCQSIKWKKWVGRFHTLIETKNSRPPSLCHQSTATAVFLGLIYTCGHPVTVTAMGQVGRSGRFGLESSKISRLYSQSENLSLRLVFLFVHMTATSLHRNVKCFRFLQHPSSTMTMTVIKHDTWMVF